MKRELRKLVGGVHQGGLNPLNVLSEKNNKQVFSFADTFKIRCSSIGNIMSAKGDLIKGNKSYLDQKFKENLYSRKKEFSSKYTDKGIIQEDLGIDLVADYLNLGMLIKNEKEYSNEYMTGTPDIVTNDLIIDIKSSWDCFTFPLFETEIPNMDYVYQLQGYMHLTGIKKAKLAYVLSDTPEHIIMQEVNKAAYSMGYDRDDLELYETIKEKHSYGHLDMSLRVKIFDLEYDESLISDVELKVNKCREYLKKLENTFSFQGKG